MPRAPRRAAHHERDLAATTPTRPTAINAITAAIPPFMLETPPHAAFLATPAPPTHNPGQTILPDTNVPRRPQAQTQQTLVRNGNVDDDAPGGSQASQNALAPATSETGHTDEQSYLESAHHDAEDIKQLRGLRDISSLSTWTLSSAKPGCALAQLRNPNPALFWQSDGPQPHTLTLHFFKLVAIVKMRIYLDFELDESYTPTKMKFFAGMSEGSLVEFGSWEVTETIDPETGEAHSSIEGIRGWIEVPLKGVGGRETRHHEIGDYSSSRVDNEFGTNHLEEQTEMGGDVLKAMVVQIRICENHQNGKDTHVRGFQVFSRDTSSMGEFSNLYKKSKPEKDASRPDEDGGQMVRLQPPDWMGDPEIR